MGADRAGRARAVVALVVAAPRPPPLPLLAPILGLWLWSLISSAWSDSTDAAHVAANRWLLYGAAIVVLSWALAGDRRRASVLLTLRLGRCARSRSVDAGPNALRARPFAVLGHPAERSARLRERTGRLSAGRGMALPGAGGAPRVQVRHRRSPGPGWPGSSPFSAWGCCASRAAGRSRWLGRSCRSRSRSPGDAAVPPRFCSPGRRSRLIYAPLSRVWRDPSRATGLVTAGATRDAAAAIIVAAIVSGVTWAAAAQLLHRLAPGRLVGQGAGAAARLRGARDARRRRGGCDRPRRRRDRATRSIASTRRSCTSRPAGGRYAPVLRGRQPLRLLARGRARVSLGAGRRGRSGQLRPRLLPSPAHDGGDHSAALARAPDTRRARTRRRAVPRGVPGRGRARLTSNCARGAARPARRAG